MPFRCAVNGLNHIIVASRVLNHFSYLVEDGWSCEVANSAFGRIGDVTFSLAVSPILPISLPVTLSSLGDIGFGAWQ